MNSSSEVYPTWNNDFVDIHGRDLKVMMADDGAIFVPFKEIRKSGFHIFPRSEFHFSRVGKSMVMKELYLYMLGAAKEFLIQNNIHSLNHDDILETIEKCKEQLIKDNEVDGLNSSKPSGTLGRTLLSDPVTINKEVRSAIQRNTQQTHVDNSHKNENHDMGSVARQTLRMPHHIDNDSFNQENDVSVDSNRKSGPQNQQRNGFGGKGNSNQNQQQQGSNGGNRNRPNGNFGYNAKFAPKKDGSRPGSEIDESETFLRLSDCKLERIKLQNTPQQVKVIYIEKNNDKLKYWVHLVENEDKIMDIIEKCIEANVYSPVYTPKLGDICMAMSIEDDLWYRAVVQRVNPLIKVHFIDFGNSAIVSQVKKLPEELSSVSAQAVRIVLPRQEGESSKSLKLNQVLSVKAIKEFVDTTILVSEDVQDYGTGSSKVATSSGNSQNETTLEPCFWLNNKYSNVLKNGELVMIVAYEAGKFYLQNKEHHMKLKETSNFIKGLPKQPLKFVEKNQLVLCKKDGEEQMCRAVVRDVDDGFVTVHFVDYHTNDSMSIKALYAVSRATVSLPVALIESPAIKGYGDGGLTEEAETLIQDMIAKRQKFNVSMNGTEFDLLIKDKPLSEMLFPAKRTPVKVDPKPKSDPSSETSSYTTPPQSPKDASSAKAAAKPYERMMYHSMTSFDAPMGSSDYMMTMFKNSQDFTVTATSDKESEMLSICTCIEVDADEGPYEPVDSEMVLARFEGDWFRGAVLDVQGDGKYDIMFVEYGNSIEVTKEDIRKLPENFKTIPMLGLSCRIDVPETEAVNKRLEELLKTENIYEMDFVSFDTENVLYTVKIPKVYDILKKEGLL